PWPPYTVCMSTLHVFLSPYFDTYHIGDFSHRLSTALTRWNGLDLLEMAGGKWVGGLSRVSEKPNCIVYSFGKRSLFFFAFFNFFSNHATHRYQRGIYFEFEIPESTRHCQIWGYDYSDNLLCPQILPNQSSRTHFFAYGLSGGDQHGPDDSPKMY